MCAVAIRRLAGPGAEPAVEHGRRRRSFREAEPRECRRRPARAPCFLESAPGVTGEMPRILCSALRLCSAVTPSSQRQSSSADSRCRSPRRCHASTKFSASSAAPPRARGSGVSRNWPWARPWLEGRSPDISHAAGNADTAPREGTRPTRGPPRSCRPRALTRRLGV